MTRENQLIQKTYYENLIIEEATENPVQFLGYLFIDEQRKDEADPSYIRFSQGEVYFHHKDFEAAIFKWEKVHNDLEQWARKNMADAYYELGQLQAAIDLYQAVNSDSLTLNSEVALKLFTIYNEQGQLDFAADVIKEAVSVNPDYPSVTKVARTFFEKYRDWSSAIELAVDEAIRTREIEWFDILRGYVEEGLTKQIPPHYFSKLLEVLYDGNQESFEKLVVAFWNSYQGDEFYFPWLTEIDRLFLHLEFTTSYMWHEVSAKYQDTYFELISGKYYLDEITGIVPNLLTNWLQLADDSDSLFAATAVMAWNETFEEALSPLTIEKAEYVLQQTQIPVTQIERSSELFKEIVKWGKTHDLNVDHRLKWAVGRILDIQTNNLLVAGMTGNGKASVIHSLIGGNIGTTPPSTVILYKNDEEIDISEVTETAIHTVSSLVDFAEMKQEEDMSTSETSLVQFKMPNKFLVENKLNVIDFPDFDRSTFEAIKNNKKEQNKFLHLADGLLFVLTATTLFTDRERDLLLKIQENVPHLPVHFLLKTDAIYHEQEVTKMVEEIRTRLAEDFPKAKVFPFSKHNKSSKQVEELAEFIQQALNPKMRTSERNQRLLFYIREALTYLLKRRVETENEMTEAILWKEDMVSKLNAAVHQLSDLEKEKMKVIQSSYHTIKEDIKLDLKMTIPKLLRDCSALIKEESDFRKIHIELNQEMNQRIHNYIEHTILPRFSKAIQGWIEMANEEFHLSQDYLEEMSEGFNMMYGEQRLKLNCDFKVLDDWSRDANRLSNGVQLEIMNILNRSTPSQLVLKSAGKLFGTLRPNKTMLCNMYKKLIENEDYEKIANTVTNQFILQFELFEKGLHRDITMFYSEPFNVIHEVIEEEQQDIQQKKNKLERLKANPEQYLDPITLFKVRLLQYEWMQKDHSKSPLLT
ncbi:GTP-binding protein [Alkalihalobacterium chitinilyticum]|uniref:GTP-binding protein n=1 Tax=Alkalihalobacterium chitinilyticum TaxID=2980103 RepID=A0ABT5VG76_9BACI|nr:GTP-binding protein [Alkalihalobacterium chitinilyticum]MDE5414473.1 GTP-binding protein [Alkalihalobacterium chitinilyticum]